MFLHTYIPEKVFLDLGFASIHWYGLVLCLAIASGFLVAQKLNRRQGILSADKLFDLFFYVVIFALLGGRLVHVLTFLNYYLKNPVEILALWHGGIAFYGVFLGGAAAIVWQSKKIIIGDEIKNKLLLLLDTVVPAVAIGQAIGRWGNWFNQELFGAPTNLAWGIPIDLINRPLGFENFQYFHPLFLYESLAMLVVFFLLLYFLKQSWSTKAPGLIFGFYLICHGCIRFTLEFLRLDIQPLIFGLRLFQIVASLEIIVGLVLLVLIKKWYNKIYV